MPSRWYVIHVYSGFEKKVASAIREQAEIKRIEPNGAAIALVIEHGGRENRVEGSHLLVAAGRKPRTAGLDLDRAGVRYNGHGIVVDRRLRTDARGVYAIGDVTNGPRFTHVASYQAGIVIRNALFHLPARVDYSALPWVTYTDPELAQVGLTENEARRQHGEDVAVSRFDFAENDRAQTERETVGTAKIVTRRNGRILGASILGAHAGELAHLWVLAIQQGLKLSAVAGMLAPYPTFGEVNKMAAVEFYKPKLFGRWTHAAVRVLLRLP